MEEYRGKCFHILLDEEDKDMINSITTILPNFEGVSFSNIRPYTDADDNVFGDIDSLEGTPDDIANKIIDVCKFKGVIEIYDEYQLPCLLGIERRNSYIKGNPITNVGFVLYNDKDKNYTELLNTLITEQNGYNIIIEQAVSTHGRKYYKIEFDIDSFDVYYFKRRCKEIFEEECHISINRNNYFDYNEMILESAYESYTPTKMEYKVVSLKKRNNYDFSGDDLSTDSRFW